MIRKNSIIQLKESCEDAFTKLDIVRRLTEKINEKVLTV